MDEFVKVYSNNRSYINKVRSNYVINNSLLQNEKIMLLIYTYEWFKIPKDNNFEKVIYHPFLTKNDQMLVDDLRTRYVIKLGLFSLTYMAVTSLYFARRYKHKPKLILFEMGNIAVTGLLAYCFWKIYLYKRLNLDVRNITELQKYEKLDVDLEKVIQELVNYNIKLI
jgi:hypothetical protein